MSMAWAGTGKVSFDEYLGIINRIKPYPGIKERPQSVSASKPSKMRPAIEPTVVDVRLPGDIGDRLEPLEGVFPPTVHRDRFEQQHIEWYKALVQEAEEKFPSTEREEWLDQLAREHDNLRLALEFAQKRNDTETMFEIAGPLSVFWFFREKYGEGLVWLKWAFYASNGQERSSARAIAHFGAGLLYRAKGDLRRALKHLKVSENIRRKEARSAGREQQQKLNWYLGFVLAFIGLTERDLSSTLSESREARKNIEDSLRLFRQIRFGWGENLALTYLGMVKLRLINEILLSLESSQSMKPAANTLVVDTIVDAIRDLSISLNKFQRLGDEWGMSQPLIYLGIAYYQHGRYDEINGNLEAATLRYEEARRKFVTYLKTHKNHEIESDIAKSPEDKRGIARCLAGLAAIANKQNYPERAAELLGAAQTLRKDLGAQIVQNDISQYIETYEDVRKKLATVSRTNAFLSGRRMSIAEAITTAIRPNLPVETISVNVTHTNSEDGICDFCGGPTEKTYIHQECWGKHKIVVAESVAGYKCRDCGIETGNLDALIEFVSKAIKSIEPTGDTSTVASLREEFNIAKRQRSRIQVPR